MAFELNQYWDTLTLKLDAASRAVFSDPNYQPQKQSRNSAQNNPSDRGGTPGRHCGQASDWLPRQWRVEQSAHRTCCLCKWAPLELSHVSKRQPQCDGPCLFCRWIFVTRTKHSTGPPKAENPTENLSIDMTCACHKPDPADLGSLVILAAPFMWNPCHPPIRRALRTVHTNIRQPKLLYRCDYRHLWRPQFRVTSLEALDSLIFNLMKTSDYTTRR